MAAFIILVVVGLNAQSRPAVKGLVVDPTGAPAADASVTLHCGSQRTKKTLTGPDGRFEFESSGSECTLAVALQGFTPISMRVTRSDEPIFIPLTIAPVRQQLTVTDQPEHLDADPGTNLDTVEINSEEFDTLPVMDQDVLGLVSSFLDDGMAGSGGYTMVVDGLETTNLGVSPSAIKEVKINKNPYSAEFYRPGRGRIEVTTKKGDSSYHGSFTALLRDYRLAARNAFATVRAPEQRRIFEGHFTGPLSRDGRTSFLVSAEYKQDDDWPLVFATTPAGLIRDQVRQPDRETELSVRVNRLIADTHSVSVRYENNPESSLNRGVGDFRLPETAYDRREGEHEVLFSHRLLVRGKFLSELRVKVRKNLERSDSRVTGRPRIVVHDAFTAGGSQNDEREGAYRMELGEVISWSAKTHFLRAGVNIRDLSRRSYADLSDRDGVFYFSSMEDYLGGNPYKFVRQSGDGSVTLWNAEVAGFTQDDWRVRDNFSLGVGLRYEYHRWPGGFGTLAPRVSFAWAPGARRNTVIRGGGGFFFDNLSSSTLRDTRLLDGFHLQQVLLTNPTFPVAIGPAIQPARLPSSIIQLGPDLRTPLLLNYSIGTEHRLWRRTSLSVTYRGIRGRRLFRSRDQNAPIPPDYVRPDPSVAIRREVLSDARSISHSLDFSFRGNLTRYFSGGILYTLGRAYNNTGGTSWIPPDNLDLSREWARADYDRANRFRSYGTVKVWKLFNLGVVFSAYSGRPYSITTGRDDNRDGRTGDRPAGVPRNGATGPGRATLDLRWSRAFPLRFGMESGSAPSLRIAVDAFNALNHVNYTRVVGNLSSPFFGQPISARSPRRVQLSFRLTF